ncbi:hypothetical protein [Pseudonocardia adelaidensis]|uniref:hypothetical protein n=1 Tax=Pseudonocardia adelaidensis TaxID=648754 RepID=UPI0031EED17C
MRAGSMHSRQHFVDGRPQRIRAEVNPHCHAEVGQLVDIRRVRRVPGVGVDLGGSGLSGLAPDQVAVVVDPPDLGKDPLGSR